MHTHFGSKVTIPCVTNLKNATWNMSLSFKFANPLLSKGVFRYNKTKMFFKCGKLSSNSVDWSVWIIQISWFLLCSVTPVLWDPCRVLMNSFCGRQCSDCGSHIFYQSLLSWLKPIFGRFVYISLIVLSSPRTVFNKPDLWFSPCWESWTSAWEGDLPFFMQLPATLPVNHGCHW